MEKVSSPTNSVKPNGDTILESLPALRHKQDRAEAEYKSATCDYFDACRALSDHNAKKTMRLTSKAQFDGARAQLIAGVDAQRQNMVALKPKVAALKIKVGRLRKEGGGAESKRKEDTELGLLLIALQNLTDRWVRDGVEVADRDEKTLSKLTEQVNIFRARGQIA
tara:strand:+ start:24 stop:521 length:498 start_codon:yes stop_codon:yes gene_type:complete